ncbi:hypothetical protein GCM10018791_41490 [Streptomyces zaomyceticus]|nr:hypothetical protein GCM10018791_41490 [Streptomyces zaomyceticus]
MSFGFELDRRPRAVGSTVLGVVAHPGGAPDSPTPSRPPVHVTPRSEPVPPHVADPAVAARPWAATGELAGTDPHLRFR